MLEQKSNKSSMVGQSLVDSQLEVLSTDYIFSDTLGNSSREDTLTRFTTLI